MRNTVPSGSVVPTLRAPPSSAPERSAGKEPVDHTTQLSWPGRREMTFLHCSSICTTALPRASWPVTTLRIFTRQLYLDSSAELDHPVGGNVEEVRDVAGVARHGGEQALAPRGKP